MAEELLGDDCLSEEYKYSWYISRREIENYSPSRKDGIDLRKESELRMLYCLFVKDIGMKLQVPQGTIATAMLFCHRFYLHQSHAKNDWQTIATACMLLACKVEETFCSLDKVVVVAYRTIYKNDPDAVRKIYQKVVFEKQKALILIAERLLLSTIRFDFNVQHPYKPLLDAFKKFGITQKEVKQYAWNFVNDSFQTTLCLQYKPHYIAAGAIFLAAKMLNVKLPSGRGYVWWNEFDVTPKLLNVATHEMAEILGFRRRPTMTETVKKPMPTPLAAKDNASSPESCVLSQPGSDFTGAAIASKPVDRVTCGSTNNMNSNPDIEKACPNSREERQSQGRVPESLNGVVEDCRGSGKVSDQLSPNLKRVDSRLSTVDSERIKGVRRKRERETSCQTDDAWIQRELESRIEFIAESNKRQRP